MEVEADTPKEAARKGLMIQRDPESTATVFGVIDRNKRMVMIDLSEENEGR